jgi:hypothetical protein
MKHIVNFSGGACAFWAAHRVIEKYGRKDVTLLFADVLIEHHDLYTFNEWAANKLGVPITRICEGRTPWQVFRDEGFIGNSKTAICSMRLKREPLDLWHRQNALEMDSIVYLGFDFTEWQRLTDLRAKRPAWRIEAPMTEPELWDKCRIIEECSKLGFPKQTLYELGFPHNNCGGRCVTAGISHWVHLLKVLPDAYAEWEREEELTIDLFTQRSIKIKTMLRDRRGGEPKNLSLKTLRLRVEAGEKFSTLDWGGCGCSTHL